MRLSNYVIPYMKWHSLGRYWARYWARAGVLANTCESELGKRGALISTAFTGRSLMQIVDAADDNGLLRFWSMNYLPRVS
jgi:hypothetical protein